MRLLYVMMAQAMMWDFIKYASSEQIPCLRGNYLQTNLAIGRLVGVATALVIHKRVGGVESYPLPVNTLGGCQLLCRLDSIVPLNRNRSAKKTSGDLSPCLGDCTNIDFPSRTRSQPYHRHIGWPTHVNSGGDRRRASLVHEILRNWDFFRLLQ